MFCFVHNVQQFANFGINITKMLLIPFCLNVLLGSKTIFNAETTHRMKNFEIDTQ